MDMYDDDDEGYVIMLDDKGPSQLLGGKFHRMTNKAYRKLTKETETMVVKNRNKRQPFINKFYVGSTDMARHYFKGLNPNNTFPTVDEALEVAKARVESGQSECEMIVQVVRIVKRANRPVTVVKL